MRHLRLTEGGAPVPTELSRAELDVLRESALVDIDPTSSPNLWLLRAARRVGVARLGDLQLTLTPKIAIERLIFLLGYSEAATWSSDEVRLQAEDDLLPAVAEVFGRLAQRALEQGLLHGYRTVEESLPVLRGRLRESEQVRRRYGQAVPLEVRFDDFTADIAENQLLLAATQRLLRLPSVGEMARRRLLRTQLLLSDVTLLPFGAKPPRWQPTRQNRRYQPALRFAEIVLAGDSFEHRVGELVVTGFTFHLWKVYEDFVTRALTAALRPYGGRVAAQDRWHLDEDRSVGMRPDLVWYLHGQPYAVIDAKYKAERPEGFPDADVYQLLAYCIGLGLPVGHLVYAQGETARTHQISRAGIAIRSYVLDLDTPPAELLAQVDALARDVAVVAR